MKKEIIDIQPNTAYAAVYARYSEGSHQTDQSIDGQLADAEPPALFSAADDVKAEGLDEALRIIAALRADPPQK